MQRIILLLLLTVSVAFGQYSGRRYNVQMGSTGELLGVTNISLPGNLTNGGEHISGGKLTVQSNGASISGPLQVTSYILGGTSNTIGSANGSGFYSTDTTNVTWGDVSTMLKPVTFSGIQSINAGIFTGSGAGLTNIPGSAIQAADWMLATNGGSSSGPFADLTATNLTVVSNASFDTLTVGTLTATNLAGNGAGLTNLAGYVATNHAGSITFYAQGYPYFYTDTNTWTVGVTNGGMFVGDGSGLTNLTASKLNNAYLTVGNSGYGPNIRWPLGGYLMKPQDPDVSGDYDYMQFPNGDWMMTNNTLMGTISSAGLTGKIPVDVITNSIRGQTVILGAGTVVTNWVTSGTTNIGASEGTLSFYYPALYSTNTLKVNGSSALTSKPLKTSGNLEVDGHLVPSVTLNSSRQLGQPTLRWHSLFVGTINAESNIVSSGSLTASNGIAWPTHCRASMSLAPLGGSNTLALTTSYSKITNYAAFTTASRNCGGSLATGEIITTNAGTYQVNFGMSYTQTTEQVEGAYYTNGVLAAYLFKADNTTAASFEALRSQALIDLPANCTNSIHLKAGNADSTFEMHAGSFNIVQQFN